MLLILNKANGPEYALCVTVISVFFFYSRKGFITPAMNTLSLQLRRFTLFFAFSFIFFISTSAAVPISMATE